MNIIKKDEISTNPRVEKLNSSDTVCLKNSNDKLMDILAKTKIEKHDLNSKSSKKIITDMKSNEDEEESFDDDDDDNIKIEKKSIEIGKTTAAEVLNQTKLDPKENLNLLKINLCYLAKKEFKWVVYHTPDEIQKFLKKVYKSIKNDDTAIKLVDITSLEKVKEYTEEQILNSIDIIQKQFNDLLQSDYFNNNLIINEFLNIGGTSFSQYNNGIKPYEGWVEKKADPHCMRRAFGYICFCLECCIFKKYNERWIVLKDDMITYSNLSNSPGGKHVYFFDEEIKARKVGKLNIKIINLSRVLELKFKSYFERELWKQELDKRISKFKNVIKYNKFKAYTNEKINNFAEWFIDGKDYFNDLYEKLMEAKKSIFITDWWMSPEVWLKRPVVETDYTTFFHKKSNMTRLMDVLEHKAKGGVKIYILLYYECSIAIKLNSKHTQDTLEKLHKNIVVTRHPTDKLDLLWSHHEKLVIIDQVIGYVGGLDLCWGRYDSNDHPIYEAPNSEKNYYYPCIDYSNARICDFINVENYLVESVSRESCVRMPWHDVHMRLIGPVVNDISRHFVERWNHARFEDRNKSSLNIKNNSHVVKTKRKSVLKRDGFLNSIIESVLKMEQDKIDSPKKKKDIPKKNTSIEEEDSFSFDIDINDNIIIGKTPVFDTKDNALQNLTNINHLENKKFAPKPKNTFNLNLPSYTRQWKTQKSSKDSQECQEKFDTIKKEWMENLNDLYEDIVPVRKELKNQIVSNTSPEKKENKRSFYSELITKLKKNKNNWFKDLFNVNNEIETIINDKYVKKGSISSTVQVLRSVGEWSMGLKVPENSILEAYYQLIDNAKHYIFIENQFFISKSFEDEQNKQYLVENKIALHLVNRILKAYRNKEKFRVYVFLPLMPGFAGEPEKSGTLQIILKYTFETICRNQGLSIIERLVNEMEPNGDHWEDYIAFFSLRNHALVNGIPKTELIYIHSKLMIVDDCYVICGSANINDRSMKGPRDSEFCALVKEKKTDIVSINGRKCKTAKFASSLRKALLAEHLGINKHDIRLNDPISDELHKLIWETARNNTDLYRQIFMCYPDDCYTKFSMIPNKNAMKNKAQEYSLKKNYEEKKNQIIGHIVEFPLHFLEEEQLGISFFSKENLVPERNFT